MVGCDSRCSSPSTLEPLRVSPYHPLASTHHSLSALGPFPATLFPRAQSRGTRNQHSCRKTAPVSPLPATLTDTPSHKSFGCHSYENTGGVPTPLPPLATKFFRRNTYIKYVHNSNRMNTYKTNNFNVCRINTCRKHSAWGSYC